VTVSDRPRDGADGSVLRRMSAPVLIVTVVG
jgi:hypothetical protein